jgi:hypothetical protein
MRPWKFTQVRFGLAQKILLPTVHQVTTISGAALTKFTWSGADSQAVSLLIGSRPKLSLELLVILRNRALPDFYSV